MSIKKLAQWPVCYKKSTVCDLGSRVYLNDFSSCQQRKYSVSLPDSLNKFSCRIARYKRYGLDSATPT